MNFAKFYKMDESAVLEIINGLRNQIAEVKGQMREQHRQEMYGLNMILNIIKFVQLTIWQNSVIFGFKSFYIKFAPEQTKILESFIWYTSSSLILILRIFGNEIILIFSKLQNKSELSYK